MLNYDENVMLMKKFTKIVTKCPEATATKFSFDHEIAFGYVGEATSATAWNLEAITDLQLKVETWSLNLDIKPWTKERESMSKSIKTVK